MKPFLILIACFTAIMAVAGTDSFYAPRYDRDWSCRTDMECEYEEYIKSHGGYCIIVGDEMFCSMPIDRR